MAHSVRMPPRMKAIYRVIAFHIILLILLMLAFKKDTYNAHPALPFARQQQKLPPIQLKRRQMPAPLSQATQQTAVSPSTTQSHQLPEPQATDRAQPKPIQEEAPLPAQKTAAAAMDKSQLPQEVRTQETYRPLPAKKRTQKRPHPIPETSQAPQRHVHAWEKLEQKPAQQKPSPPTEHMKKPPLDSALQELYRAPQMSHASGNKLETDGIETVIELTQRINKSFQETALSKYITESYYAICNALNRNPFYPREEDTAYRCIIYLTLRRDGTIIHMDAEKECASLATNEVCAHFLNTMHTMGKLRPLPQSYEQETFTLPIPIDERPAYRGNPRTRGREPLTFYLR